MERIKARDNFNVIARRGGGGPVVQCKTEAEVLLRGRGYLTTLASETKQASSGEFLMQLLHASTFAPRTLGR